eukprot:TRINITY_DN25893_c0_g3_i1.p1 TRINITY_DN25893_c0_g3~~TRINITY_DN25893_c0_g3_i1.p1  ORF type:complete len:415 (+),score=109.46 TRINITY_DN25893_c0_g3_i1:99-1247(+)
MEEEAEEYESGLSARDGQGSSGGSVGDVKSPKTNAMDPMGPDEDPEYRYVGMMRDGKKNGQGRLVFRFGVYEGNWNNDMMEGHGKMMLKSGNIYEGEFSRNRFEGRGVLRWRNGKVYTGTMRSGNMSGKGKLVSKDGEYEGDFYHNEFFGHGKMTFANGDVYEGEWKQDMMWGQGCLRSTDSTQFDGTFYKNQKHGRILRTDPKNKVYSERYEHDQLKTSYKVKKQSKASSAVEKFLSKVISSPVNPTLAVSSHTDSLFERTGASKEDVARHLDRRARSHRSVPEHHGHGPRDEPDRILPFTAEASPIEASEKVPPKKCDVPARKEHPEALRIPSKLSQCTSSPDSTGLPPPLPPCPPPPADHFSSLKKGYVEADYEDSDAD